MANRSIQAGEVLKLRARFRDDLDQVTQASGVYVHIFEPNVDVTDLSLALVVSGIPTYLGEGIFEYEYTAPSCGPEGTWHDSWEGLLACQEVAAVLSFDVLMAGTVTELENQLFNNDLVQITLPSGLAALDGSTLGEEYNFEFMTTTSPSYTNVRKVRLEVGGFLGNVEDDTIQTSILEASIEADTLTFMKTQTNSKLYLHARREYVTCLAAANILSNLGNLQIKSKTLADLSVTYDTNTLRNMFDKMQGCLEKWAPQLMSAGGARAVTQPSYVVKGALDPDRPAVGRLWESPVNGYVSGDPKPLANTKGKTNMSRRYLNTFWTRGKKWW